MRLSLLEYGHGSQPVILKTLKAIKRAFIFLIGGTVLLIGLVMIVAPGPSVLVIPLGLGILATEFVWARVWLQRMRDKLKFKKNNGNGEHRGTCPPAAQASAGDHGAAPAAQPSATEGA
jgi:tellurite resistance protein TerC